jgi:glucosylceramidase
VGFGGAFTEAAALNWRSLSEEDQEAVIQLYFGSPAEGGHGYSLGRVPINSCDFSPASYNFDNVTGDKELAHFDTSVKHDVEVRSAYHQILVVTTRARTPPHPPPPSPPPP